MAHFSMPGVNAAACDFGTGCGIIPFYWKRENAGKVIYAVEIQQKAYNQLCRSVELNGIKNIIPIESDLRELKGKIPFGSLDVIAMNPPYTGMNAGIISSSDTDKIARHETLCTLSDICLSASKLLKFGGRLCMCIRPERLFEMTDAMQNAKIEPKRLRFVSQCDSRPPWLVLVEGKLGRKPGLVVEPELHIEQKDGSLSEEMSNIIGEYKKN
ncbi:MAG: methyltransferase [Clostridiales bacterium]|nr:methyltransferase [Clostridiales bacterium]